METSRTRLQAQFLFPGHAGRYPIEPGVPRAADPSRTQLGDRKWGGGDQTRRGQGCSPTGRRAAGDTEHSPSRRIDGRASGEAVKRTRGEPFACQPRPSYFPGVKGEARALGPVRGLACPTANTNRAVGFCPTTGTDVAGLTLQELRGRDRGHLGTFGNGVERTITSQESGAWPQSHRQKVSRTALPEQHTGGDCTHRGAVRLPRPQHPQVNPCS